MHTSDLVSVIFPAYNHERFIEETVRSVIAQTYRNLELIVIDDGSKDGTFAKLQSLKSECERRFVRVVFETQENQGAGATLNRLIDQAQGDYIYAIASDDVSKPNAVEVLHAFLAENPDYVLAVGDNEIIDGHSNRIYWGKKQEAVAEKEEAVFLTMGDALKLNGGRCDFGAYAELLKGNHLPNGQLSRREALLKTGKYDPAIYLEDWYMNLQLSKLGKFKYIPEILFSYRWHGGNTVLSDEFRARQQEIYRQIYRHEKEYAFANGHKKLWKRLWCKRFGWRGKWNKIRNFLRGKK